LVRKKINRQKALEFLRKTWKLRFLPLLRNWETKKKLNFSWKNWVTLNSYKHA
jgi:hypothetical protein